ncbi:MAG TPA: helix-turn-helix transcriptional regulator [Polyangia bacterium]|nr:helix-turn-helix transcriptional regulator [Polyangia bacterium]
MAKSAAHDLPGADFAALMEAAYRSGDTDADWLERIVRCAQPGLDRGRGLIGCLFATRRDGTPSVTAAVGVGALTTRPEALAATFLPSLAEKTRHGGSSAIFGCACDAAGTGAHKYAAVVATDAPPGQQPQAGFALLAPLPRAAEPPRDASALWTRVAHHLAAALRLRRAGRHEQTVWQGLLCGRWRLIDHFDAGGRRFIIARGKPAGVPQPLGRLSGRERDACARAATGRANKEIAAELGVAVSTVGMLLLRAARKLRCASREELIRAFRFVEGRWHQDKSDLGRPEADQP